MLVSTDEQEMIRAAARALATGKSSLRASEAFMRAAHEGLRMHGGGGMTDEHDIGLCLACARAAEAAFGDAIVHRDRCARLRGF